jgi:TRAP-type C4-dicarboxylate transport system substrate-binding protein
MAWEDGQQGTIDGALGGIKVFTPFAYYSTTKYANETSHAQPPKELGR